MAKMNVGVDRKDNFGHLDQDRRELCVCPDAEEVPLGVSATLVSAAHEFHEPELFLSFILLN